MIQVVSLSKFIMYRVQPCQYGDLIKKKKKKKKENYSKPLARDKIANDFRLTKDLKFLTKP